METKSKRKGLKFLSKYILLFLFVCGGALMGVALALSLIEVPIGGKIIFNATNIYAQVTGTISGSKSENALETLNFDYETSAFTTPESWSNMKLDFEADKNIELTITITNLSDERLLWVTFVENIQADNVSTSRQVDGVQVNNFTNQVVAKSGTKVIKLVWSVSDVKKPVTDGTFNLDITLTNERVAVDEAVYADSMKFNSFNTSAKTCTVTKGDSTTATVLDIPDKILHSGVEYTVTKIANDAFRDYTTLEKVVIPSTVKSIGARAFMNITTLKSVTLNEGLTTFETQVFSGCSAIESIEIPSTVTTVGTWVFSGCSGAKSVTIKEGVKAIGYGMFNGCSNAEFTNVTIPASVNTIGAFAFQNCSSLKSIKFKNLVKWDAVHNSDATKTASDIDVSDASKNVTLLRDGSKGYKEYNWTRTTPRDTDYTGKLTFTYNNTTKTATVKGADSTQTSITIPSDVVCNQTSLSDGTATNGTIGQTYTVTEIGADGFKDYTSLTKVIMPNTIQTINACAFYNCSKLTSIILPDSVLYVKAQAFDGCSAVTELSLSKNLKIIDYWAFSSLTKLTTLYIPENVQSIDGSSFGNNQSLSQINVANENSIYYSENNCIIQRENKKLIVGCSKSQIPNDIKIIGARAFFWQKDIESIDIPNSVETIEGFAFQYCQGLKTINFSLNLSTIGQLAFDGTNLQFANFGTNINNWNYDGEIINPTSLSNTETAATCLKENYKEHTWERITPKDTDYTGKLTFTYDNTAKTASVKGADSSQSSIIIPNEVICNQTSLSDGTATNGTIGQTYKVTVIGEKALMAYTKLTSVFLPDTINTFEFGAFWSSAINSIEIPKSVTSIPDNCFAYCGQLKFITIHENIKSVGGSAFYACTKLSSVTIEEGVTEFGWGVFKGCTALASITLPSSLKWINSSAFVDCSLLTSVTFKNATGWKAGSTSVSFSDLSNSSTAAQYLTNNYSSSIWTRS